MSPRQRLSRPEATAQGQVTAVLTDAIAAMSDVEVEGIETALAAGFDPLDLFPLQAAYQQIGTELPNVILAPLAHSAFHAFDGLNVGIGRINTRFNITDARATSYAATRSARLVTAIDNETRGNVTRIIGRAFTDNLDIPDTARAIREVVGLTPQWANAVYNFQAGLIDKGTDPDYIDKMVGRYSDHLINVRSETIARTEVLEASNEGRSQGWNQAAEHGLFNAATATKEWSSGGSRTCDTCSGLDGTEVALGDGWEVDGEVIDMPPAHPRCRCTALLHIDGGVVEGDEEAAD